MAHEENESEIYFWGKNSFLSNFHSLRIPFNEDKHQFTSSEQYLQYHKAKFFNDEKAMKSILESDDPSFQKRVRVNGYKETEWYRIAPGIMREGLRKKFESDPKLKAALVNTGNKALIEASPSDKFWGIGCGLHTQKITQKNNCGKNILGKTLMKVRDDLR